MTKWWPFGAEEIKQDYEAASTFPVGYGQDWFESANVDNKDISQQAFRSAIVYACVRELCTSITEPRFTVLQPTTQGEPVEAPDNNPIRRILENPNDDGDFDDLLENLVTMYYLTGNVFLHKERSASGTLQSIRVLRTDRIEIKSTPERGVTAYKYTLNGREYYINPKDISHLRFPNPNNDLYGYSPVQAAASVLNLDLAQIAYSQSFMRNQATPAGLLTVKKRLQSEEEANRIRSRWRSTFGGANRFSVAVLDEDATFQQLGSRLGDIAFPELRDTVEARLSMCFGVPPILISSTVGLDRATYSNYREARLTYMNQQMQPLSNKIARWFTRCFSYEFRDAGYVVADFSRVAALAEDLTVLSDRVISQFNAGLISLNEARNRLSLDPLQGGEVRRLPMNIIENSTDNIQPTLLSPVDGNTLSITSDEMKALPSSLEPDSNYTPEPVRVQPTYRGMLVNLLDDRIQEVDELVPKLEAYFRRLQNRADGILGRFLQDEPDATKAEYQLPFTASEILPIEARNELAGILRNSYSKVVREAFKTLAASGAVGVIEYSEKLPIVQRVLAHAAERGALIHSTTYDAVDVMIQQGMARGYSVNQIANGVVDDNYKGLRSVVRDTYRNRPANIARTEVMRAQNQITLGYYTELGHTYFMAIDEDGSPDDTYVAAGDGRTCSQRNGQVYHISQQPMDIEDHPSGTLSWTPMPPSYKPDAFDLRTVGSTITETAVVSAASREAET